MSTPQVTNVQVPGAAGAAAVPFRLEAVVVPVADFDRARDFYVALGWRVDAEVEGDGDRLMQLTPPGSGASVLFGTRVTAARPGSFDGLLLVVDDLDIARADLLSRGVEVSEVFHDANGGLAGGFHIGDEGRAAGHDPERRSYASYASFFDSEGNRWVLQEITTRLPGRVSETDMPEVAPLAALLQETAQHHDAYEKVAPPHDWWDWYAAYLHSRQSGGTPDEAARHAGRYLADTKGVIVPSRTHDGGSAAASEVG
ncbi:MAG TPA: VOC family protein [Micromonosporaceae bacterium]|nr:VOC family protein [Micromonosporaceae bacterium]